MAKFVISSTIKRVDDRQFIAVACAIPYEVGPAREPDERTRLCDSLAAARAASLDMASDLSYEINERGDRVVDFHIRH